MARTKGPVKNLNRATASEPESLEPKPADNAVYPFDKIDRKIGMRYAYTGDDDYEFIKQAQQDAGTWTGSINKAGPTRNNGQAGEPEPSVKPKKRDFSYSTAPALKATHDRVDRTPKPRKSISAAQQEKRIKDLGKQLAELRAQVRFTAPAPSTTRQIANPSNAPSSQEEGRKRGYEEVESEPELSPVRGDDEDGDDYLPSSPVEDDDVNYTPSLPQRRNKRPRRQAKVDAEVSDDDVEEASSHFVMASIRKPKVHRITDSIKPVETIESIGPTMTEDGEDDEKDDAEVTLTVLEKFAKRRKNAPTRNYTGSWKTTYAGPLKNSGKALKAPKPENNTSNPDDKVWEIAQFPEPKTQERCQAIGLDFDDEAVRKNMLTLRFVLKQDKTTTMEIMYDEPDWDSQAQISELIKKIGQECRRKAGCRAQARWGYSKEEEDFIVEWFESRPDKQGEQPTKTFEELTTDFNERFAGRDVYVKTRKVTIKAPERTWHGLWGKCNRIGEKRIHAARKWTPSAASEEGRLGKKRKRDSVVSMKTMGEETVNGEMVDEEHPVKKAQVAETDEG